MEEIRRHKDLRVFQLSFEAGMEIYRMTKRFPKEETYSLKDQIRRSSRSVSGNIAEAWRKRIYPKSFVSKLNDSEGEAAETKLGWEPEYDLNGLLEDMMKSDVELMKRNKYLKDGEYRVMNYFE
jgi:four helix bundle protein